MFSHKLKKGECYRLNNRIEKPSPGRERRYSLRKKEFPPNHSSYLGGRRSALPSAGKEKLLSLVPNRRGGGGFIRPIQELRFIPTGRKGGFPIFFHKRTRRV